MNKVTISMCATVLAVFTALISGVARGEPAACTNVYAALRFLHDSADASDIGEESLMSRNFELRFDKTSYLPLVVAMSNNWQSVLCRLDDYATNRVDRLLLINTGWWCGEDIYLGYLARLSELVVSNRLNSCEFDAFEGAAWNRHTVASSVFRRCREQDVSNAVVRIISFSQRTNHWNGAFSGSALMRYERQVADGLWD